MTSITIEGVDDPIYIAQRDMGRLCRHESLSLEDAQAKIGKRIQLILSGEPIEHRLVDLVAITALVEQELVDEDRGQALVQSVKGWMKESEETRGQAKAYAAFLEDILSRACTIEDRGEFIRWVNDDLNKRTPKLTKEDRGQIIAGAEFLAADPKKKATSVLEREVKRLRRRYEQLHNKDLVKRKGQTVKGVVAVCFSEEK